MGSALFVLSFMALLNWYTAQHVYNHWPMAQTHAEIFWISAAAFFLLEMFWFAAAILPSGRRARRKVSRWMPALYFMSYLALGIFSVLFVYTFVADAIAFVLRFVVSAAVPAYEDRAMLVVLTLTLLTVVVGIIQILTGPVIKKVDVPIKNLPERFHGFKIVQISDLHVGPTIGRAFTEKAVRLANNLKPDLVALTGDFIDGTVEQLKEDIAPLKELEAQHGVFFVTGNHEYYWGVSDWVQEFIRLGARVLTNEHEVIRKDGDEIIIAGVTDYSTARGRHPHASDPRKAAEGAPAGRVKILLAHTPGSFTVAEEAGFDLQLSGHTHNGQYFPFSLIIRFFHRYHRGLNRHNNMWIYVSNGTGYWGPPLRTFVPAEITLLRLVRA